MPDNPGVVINGDVREVLPTLPTESARCCVTSPPYWGLRDYDTGVWEGGTAECNHQQASTHRSTLTGGTEVLHSEGLQRKVCRKCGAIRVDDAQLGHEPTIEGYVRKIVAIFAEVRRILTPDGTLWLNLGDSYAGGGGHCPAAPSSATSKAGKQGRDGRFGTGLPTGNGIKPKDLCGIPWRVALALQADGWWLRNDIIWHKPNGMPESVTDRCTMDHEYLFLLSKSATYYFDADAIAESCSSPLRGREKQNGEGWVETKSRGHGSACGTPSNLRNRRTVWSINTQGYSDAHFAAFPEALVEPCILAGSALRDTVIDPFAGRGTTGVVSLRLGRRFLGVELNPEYAALARRNIGGQPLNLFAEGGANA